jgi:hypothetical protein
MNQIKSNKNNINKKDINLQYNIKYNIIKTKDICTKSLRKLSYYSIKIKLGPNSISFLGYQHDKP